MITVFKSTRYLKLIVPIITILFTFIFANAMSEKLFSSIKLKNYVEGEILIQFENQTSEDKKTSAIKKIGIEFEELEFSNLTRVIIKNNITEKEAIAICQEDTEIISAQYNFIYRAMELTNDPNIDALWGLDNAEQTMLDPTYEKNNPGTPGKDINISTAWEYIDDCKSIIVAIIDSGVNIYHEELMRNMWDGTNAGYKYHGYNFIDNNDYPMDLNGHGTHIAGIIGAEGFNNIGISGICTSIQLMPIRVLDEAAEGTTSTIVQGINFAINNEASIINISSSGHVPYDRAFSEAIDLAEENDILVVVAAGNGGIDATSDDNDFFEIDNDLATKNYPCSFDHDNLICVAALDQKYELADFSNYGSESVDIGAPGTNIYSTYLGEITTISDDFTADWIKTGEWQTETIDLGFGVYDMLINPTNWDAGLYKDNADERVYKQFDLSHYDSATLSFYAFINTEYNRDYLNLNIKQSGGDPFQNGETLDSYTGSTDDEAYMFNYSLNNFLSKNTSIGFQLQSDEKNSDTGSGILLFEISALKINNRSYKLIDGTSMASAHVAGIAGLVKAYNPDYTYIDLVNAIVYGGDSEKSLLNRTVSGKAVDALGSLQFINQPVGITAEVE